MAVTVLTYSNIYFFKSQLLAKKAALSNGADKVIMRDDIWLRRQNPFYKKNRKILDQPRGAGYWLWKPYIILEALRNLSDDDILVYHDSGAEIIGNIKPLTDLVNEKKILLFRSHGYTNSGWTKRDCFYFMDCDLPKYYDGPQVWAGFIVLKKTSDNIRLVSNWLEFASNKHILTDDKNISGLENLPDFQDHRHDQAILSLLAIKNEIEIFRDPSQYGDLSRLSIPNEKHEAYHHNSPYPTLINSHRIRHGMQLDDFAYYYYYHKRYGKLLLHYGARFYRYLRSI